MQLVSEPSALRETEHDAARISRRLAAQTPHGIVSTTLPPSHGASAYGSPEYICESPLTPGNIVLCMSELTLTVKNMNSTGSHASVALVGDDGRSLMTSPRLTLIGSLKRIQDADGKVSEAYLRAHPDARWWVGWRDFAFYELDVRSLYFVGGFGNAHYIGFVDVGLYRNPRCACSEDSV